MFTRLSIRRLITLVFIMSITCALIAVPGLARPLQTEVSGVISANATWTPAGSPYNLTDDVSIAGGAVLTIQPGVVVNGNDHDLAVLGTLKAVGSAQSPIVFNLAHIQGGNTSHTGPFFHIELQHARLNGGRLYEPTGGGAYGSLTLRDSVLTDTKIDPPRFIDNNGLYVWYPTSDSVNLTSGQWSYELWDGAIWSDVKGLRYAPASLNFPSTLHPGFDDDLLAFAAAGDDAVLLSLEGDVQPLATDGQGNKLGYENGQLVNTIPGAAFVAGVGFNPADPNAKGPEMLYLPAGATYDIAIQPTASGLYTATLFGNGSAVSLDAVQAATGQNDKLTLNGVLDVTFDPSNDGDYCHYATREVTDDASRSYESCVSGAAGAPVGFSLAAGGQLTVYNQGGAAIQMTSRIEQVGAGSGVEEQQHEVAPGGSVTVSTQGEGNAGNVYLPLIAR